MEGRITTVVCPCCGDEIEVVVDTDVETVATEKNETENTGVRTREQKW